MLKPPILQSLENAQVAHRIGDFAHALEYYEHFFDHALDEDPYALYGARLSHCLNGWAELAQVFPGAKSRLDSKRCDTLEHFLEVREPETFHDYLSICRALGDEEQALEQFLKLHQSEPNDAVKLGKYLWDDLVGAEQWQVCSELMDQTSSKLDELFAVFDEASRLKEFDSSFDDIRFEQHIVDTLLDGLEKVALVLRHSSRTNEIRELKRLFQLGVDARNHSILSKQAHAKSSYLFAGH